MALAYYERGHGTENDQGLFVQYMWTDPARWADWTKAVKRALADGGVADPDHSGRYQLRGAWPTLIEE